MLTTQLIQALEPKLNCNRARLKCLCLLIVSVLRHRTVNLTILATTDDGKSCTNESRYRRFQDFFLRFALCLPSVAKVILSRLPKPPGGYVLAMDRTNWQFGRTDINFLVIAIVVGKVSIPLVWMILPRKTKSGNSNTAQRIKLTEKLLALIPAQDIRVLAMDREFGGKQWLGWLNRKEIGFVLRIKKNTVVGNRLAEARQWPGDASPGNASVVYGNKGLNLFFACKRMQKDGRDTHLIVISNRFQGKEALQLYRQRWGNREALWTPQEERVRSRSNAYDRSAETRETLCGAGAGLPSTVSHGDATCGPASAETQRHPGARVSFDSVSKTFCICSIPRHPVLPAEKKSESSCDGSTRAFSTQFSSCSVGFLLSIGLSSKTDPTGMSTFTTPTMVGHFMQRVDRRSSWRRNTTWISLLGLYVDLRGQLSHFSHYRRNTGLSDLSTGFGELCQGELELQPSVAMSHYQVGNVTPSA